MKKIFILILALFLALGVSLPIATPAMAAIGYDPSVHSMDIEAGTSGDFNLTIQDLIFGETYDLLLVDYGPNKLPDDWVHAEGSFTVTESDYKEVLLSLKAITMKVKAGMNILLMYK